MQTLISLVLIVSAILIPILCLVKIFTEKIHKSKTFYLHLFVAIGIIFLFQYLRIGYFANMIFLTPFLIVIVPGLLGLLLNRKSEEPILNQARIQFLLFTVGMGAILIYRMALAGFK
jgi:hypothetical protein